MNRALKSFATVLPGLLRDTLGLAGAAFVAYGAWQIYPPAGFVVGGALMIVAAWLAARASTGAG